MCIAVTTAPDAPACNRNHRQIAGSSRGCAQFADILGLDQLLTARLATGYDCNLTPKVSTMPSNDTTTSPQQHVGSTAELGPVPMLHPCPFCGEPLAVKWRKVNPSARCITEDCWAASL